VKKNVKCLMVDTEVGMLRDNRGAYANAFAPRFVTEVGMTMLVREVHP